ncbi:MAG: helix-turn-helix domain-containing protein [Bacilli bacterium]|nr:helix-turn-helix domain-containing protein [Bacilli bacterium]
MISENLYSLRKLNKLTQEEVAEKIGVSRQAVAKWENGETLPDIEKCSLLAELYDVTIDDLINYSKKENRLNVPPKGKYVFGMVTVGERGQIVIPNKARKIFDIKSGDKLIILGDEQQGLAIIKEEFLLQMVNDTNRGENNV